MRVHGFFPSHPITMVTWPGQDDPVVIDGHTRRDAALEVGIAVVPVVIFAFEAVMAALERAVSLQAQHRFSTNGAYYRMCETYDTLMERGRKAKEAKELTTRGVNFVGPSASAKKTAQLIGCSYRTVDRIRKIRRDGWPEIQEAVANDELTINKAYKLIRDMELGKDDGEKKASVRLTKAVQTVLGEDVFENMRNLEGELLSLVKTACEEFIRRRGDQERSEIQERK
jgi:ParB-like chromosome segregation protein Spo0J